MRLTLGSLLTLQHNNRSQPGDPAKGARVFYEVAKMDDPPLRIAVGTDAYAGIQDKIKQYSEWIPKYKELSSTCERAKNF